MQQSVHTGSAHPLHEHTITQVLTLLTDTPHTLTNGRSFLKSKMPSTTLQFPLEAFMFDGVTFISTIKGRAYIQRLASPNGAEFEMCALCFLNLICLH
jgi:hypothetical protein